MVELPDAVNFTDNIFQQGLDALPGRGMNQSMTESFLRQLSLDDIDRDRPIGGLNDTGLMIGQTQACIDQKAAVFVVLLNICFGSGTIGKKRQAFESRIWLVGDLENG